ncbi:MAG: PqiC family protein [Alphaproteobacteria bacterium]|nr:PqiC family protein [Alphaproteobacteria bacterium]
MRIVISAFLALSLAACSAAAPDRFLIEPVSTGQTVKTSAGTISVMTVNLPSYAKETGIYVQNQTGAIVAIPKADWADDTERAMRLHLVRSLADMTGADVASDPWPLGGVPEAEVRVDVEQMYVDKSGIMRLSGQFSIRRDRAESRNRIRQFDIETRAAAQTPAAIVDAHGKAWQQLADAIAKSL